jgi:hypothetical protein
MAFKMKRHDTLPNLPFQIFEPDGTTPLDLANATDVYLAVRYKRDLTVLFKNRTVIDDEVNGIGHYSWSGADTIEEGEYQYEFEIQWADGNIQTVPVDSYLDLIIISDIA